MKALASFACVLALVAGASAAQQSYFFHHAATPVAVPGGTSSFFLDDTAPTAATPTVESGGVISGRETIHHVGCDQTEEEAVPRSSIATVPDAGPAG